MAISAKSDADAIEIVKQRIRRLLDCYAELEEKTKDDTANTYNRMVSLVAERGPKVI